MSRLDSELVKAFNVQGHLNLLNSFLGLGTSDELLIDNYMIGGKIFNILKNDKGLIVNCEDGRLLYINFNSVTRLENGHFGPVSAVNIEYRYGDNILRFLSLLQSRVVPGVTSEIPFGELIDSSMLLLEHKGEDKVLIARKYVNGEVVEGAVSSLDIFDDESNLIFFGNGTIMYDGVRLTGDGENITEFKGNKLPSREEVFSFELEKEKAKLNNRFALISQELHPVTMVALTKDISELDSKVEYISEARAIYDQYTTDSKKALVDCERFKEGMTHQLFTNDELLAVCDAISMKNKKENGLGLKKEKN